MRQACHIVEEELELAAKNEQMELPWQYFAVIMPVKTVGVQGDVRAYGNTIAVRAVQSYDAMTAQAIEIPYSVLKKISEPYLPHDLIHRRKTGLLLPIQEWLLDPNALGRYLEDITSPNSLVESIGKPLS